MFQTTRSITAVGRDGSALTAARATLLACAVALTLAGCGGDDSSASTGGSPSGDTSGGSGGSGGGGTDGGGTGGGGGGTGDGGGTGGQPPAAGKPVVYLADQDIAGKYELYRVDPAEPGVSIKLSAPLDAEEDVDEFELSPDGAKVFYTADAAADGRWELYMVDLAQPGVSTKVNPSLPFGRDVIDWTIRPDGGQVVYRADQNADGLLEIFAVDVAAPGNSTRVSASLTQDGWVRAGFHYSADGTQLVYRADQTTVDVPELFLVDMSTPGVAARVNPDLVDGGSVSSGYRFSPDGQSIAYIADQDAAGVLELYAASVTLPGTATKLNGVLVEDGDLCRFEWSPDSSRIAYCGDIAADGVHELFVVEMSQPGVHTRLNPPLVAGGEVSPSFDFSADSASVFYIARQDSPNARELYRVDIAAPQAATKLNAQLVDGGDVEFFSLRPDNGRIAYVADQEADGYYNLYEVDLATPGTATRMNPEVAGSGVYDFVYTADGSKFVYSASQDDDYADLYTVDVATPGASTKLNAQMAPEGELWSFDIAQ